MKKKHYYKDLVVPFMLLVLVAGCGQIRQAQKDIYKPVVTAPDGPDDSGLMQSVTGLDNREAEVRLSSAIAPWLGVPYKYGGNSRSGIDCSGLVMNVMQEVRGITLHRSSIEMMKETEPIDRSELQPGDLVFFKTGGQTGYHVGIYTGNGKFVHASTSKGVIISSLEEPYYARHYHASGRIK